MESKIHPGYTAFKSKAPGPGRYTIQVDLADGNGRWCETWFALADIPSDYGGVMGVPVTYLQKHDPSQFEIVGSDRWEGGSPVPGRRFSVGGDSRYARVLIRRPDGWDQAVGRAVDEAVSRLVSEALRRAGRAYRRP